MYHADLGGLPGSAWHLDDASQWWLRLRTGAYSTFKYCGYCYMPPYRWWMLYRGQPSQWITEPIHWWRWYQVPDEEKIHYGMCTHRHLLSKAMPLVERAYDKHIMKTLANL